MREVVGLREEAGVLSEGDGTGNCEAESEERMLWLWIMGYDFPQAREGHFYHYRCHSIIHHQLYRYQVQLWITLCRIAN